MDRSAAGGITSEGATSRRGASAGQTVVVADLNDEAGEALAAVGVSPLATRPTAAKARTSPLRLPDRRAANAAGTAQLVAAATGEILWSGKIDVADRDLITVQDAIAAGVVEAVKAQLPERCVVDGEIVIARDGRHLRVRHDDARRP